MNFQYIFRKKISLKILNSFSLHQKKKVEKLWQDMVLLILSMFHITVMYFSPESDSSVLVGLAFMKSTLKCFLIYVQDPNDIMQV